MRALRGVVGIAQIADPGLNRSRKSRGEQPVDREAVPQLRFVTAVENGAVAAPELEADHFAAQGSFDEYAVQRRTHLAVDANAACARGDLCGQDALDVNGRYRCGAVDGAGLDLMTEPGSDDDHAGEEDREAHHHELARKGQAADGFLQRQQQE